MLVDIHSNNNKYKLFNKRRDKNGTICNSKAAR